MSNVLITLGVLCILVALGVLAGTWWAVLVLGGVLVFAGWRQWLTEQAAAAVAKGDG
jgi:phosphatidylglycerophosphate synthase